MIIEKTSIFTGTTHRREIPIKPDDYEAWTNASNNDPKRHIQNAAPYLSVDDREYMISGATPEEWARIFGDED